LRSIPEGANGDDQGTPDQGAKSTKKEESTTRRSPSNRGSRKLAAWQEDFIDVAAEAAQTTQQATGVPASVTIAQAILESNWGRSTIGANNYFGIKATTKPGPAGVVWANTREYTKQGWITVKAPFRAYENMAQSFADHAAFFVENPRYAEALRNAADPKLFAKLIHKAGYATDPRYSESLIKLMDRHDLYRYDRLAKPTQERSQGESGGQGTPDLLPSQQPTPVASPTVQPTPTGAAIPRAGDAQTTVSETDKPSQ
jgi:flagellum-specific peptidoglycan hydrolase FlgJ